MYCLQGQEDPEEPSRIPVGAATQVQPYLLCASGGKHQQGPKGGWENACASFSQRCPLGS